MAVTFGTTTSRLIRFLEEVVGADGSLTFKSREVSVEPVGFDVNVDQYCANRTATVLDLTLAELDQLRASIQVFRDRDRNAMAIVVYRPEDVERVKRGEEPTVKVSE